MVQHTGVVKVRAAVGEELEDPAALHDGYATEVNEAFRDHHGVFL
jgi:hypothetical protein